MTHFYDKDLQKASTKYIDVRAETITDRHTEDSASDGADDILNMDDDGELSADDSDKGQS